MRSGVQHHIAHHADIVHRAVDLEGVIVKVRHVVVVVVDRDRTAVPELARRIVRALNGVRAIRIAIGLHIDAIMEIGDIVVGDDVTLAVDLDRVL